MCRAIVENVLSGTKAGFKATRNLVFNQKAERSTMNRQKSRAIVENGLSGTKAGFKATPNLVFNQKAERSTMNRQKSRAIVENGLSGTKAGFKSILNLVFNQKAERKKMDHQKSKSTVSAILLSLTLMVTAFWVSSAVAAEKKYVTDPSNGKVYTAPEYGGTITQVLNGNDRRVDAYSGGPGSLFITSGVLEKLAMTNWAIDRDTYPFVGGYLAPVYALRGALAESWEQPDNTTYIFHIRQGVHWHDKPPVSGRELTAKDVEHTFHRMLGNKLTGTEFSEAEPSPGGGSLLDLPFESVTATDKYTVVMKLKEPRLRGLGLILDWNSMVIQPPELLEEYGDDWDWQSVVGTGPFELTDLVPRSSVTWTKNPNYWGFDEKYPENRLPYVDEVKGLVILEVPTRLAGLRSGKIDFIGWPGATQLNTLDQAESLMRTNPELVVHRWSERSNTSISLNQRRPLWGDDIRVRHAMQMALDLETMNATFYKGYADTIPRGLVGREFKDYHVPFEEWPKELKGYYTYDPARAEALLDEAGYPRGADGFRFKATFLADPSMELVELQAAYWREIGVDVVIETRSGAEFGARRNAGDYDLTWWNAGIKADPFYPLWAMTQFYGGTARSYSGVSDAQYDALYEAMVEATTMEEATRLTKEMDMRIIEQHWFLWGPLAPEFTVHQPWVIGYNAEGGFGASQNHVVFSRLWIDSELKKEMGY